ncbi:MAG: methyltransferase domain-containing protein [Anaerolineae bacterium]
MESPSTPTPSPYSPADLLRWPRWKVWLKRVLVATRLAGAALQWWRAHRASPPPGRPPASSAGQALRLNLGCGQSHYQGYLHADLIWHSHLDFQADARALPLRDGCLEELLATELLEHLDEEGGRRFLGEAARTLAPGGYLVLTTPDLDLLCRAWQAGILPHRQMMQHLYGDQRDHRTLYTAAMVVARCQEAGLVVRRCIPYWGPAWAHVLVVAQKPTGGASHGG